MAVPPLIVQGSIDGATWTDLGTLVPATGADDRAVGLAVRAAVGPGLVLAGERDRPARSSALRVGFGSSGPQSAVVTLADLPSAGRPTNVSGPQISSTSTTGVAAPVDSGVDQAPLSVQVLDNASTRCRPLTRATSGSITARPAPTCLITNLFPTGGDVNSFIGVSPYAGAYPNNGPPVAGNRGPSTGSTTWRPPAASTRRSSATWRSTPTRRRSASRSTCTARRSPRRTTPPAASGIRGRMHRLRHQHVPLAQITTSTTGALTPAMYLDTSSGVIGSSRRRWRRRRCPVCRCNTPTGPPSTSGILRHSRCRHGSDSQRHSAFQPSTV